MAQHSRSRWQAQLQKWMGTQHITHMWYLKNFRKEGKFLLRLVLLVTIKYHKCKFKE